MFSTFHLRFPLQHRLIAVLAVALVMVLTVLAVRPDLHESLCHHHTSAAQHESSGEPNDAGCVVTDFVNGHLLLLLLLVLLSLGRLRVSSTLVRKVAAGYLPPSYELPPGCGPPQA